MLDNRIIFDYEDDRIDAEDALEEAGEDFDYDSGDRMMVSDEGIEVLDEAGIDYDLV